MGSVTVALALVTLWVTFAAGWVVNILWLIEQPYIELSARTVVAIIGIFLAPVGSIHGISVWLT